MKVMFLRHAESEFNANPQSKTKDCPLSKRGRDQARALTNELGHFSLVIVSPLQRAKETLQLSNISYDVQNVNDLVREFRVDPCDFLEDESVDDVESDHELIERGDQFIQYLHEIKPNHERILIVSHCEFICSITGESPRNAESVWLTLDH